MSQNAFSSELDAVTDMQCQSLQEIKRLQEEYDYSLRDVEISSEQLYHIKEIKSRISSAMNGTPNIEDSDKPKIVHDVSSLCIFDFRLSVHPFSGDSDNFVQ